MLLCFCTKTMKHESCLPQNMFVSMRGCGLCNKPAFSVMPSNWMAPQHGWPCSESTRRNAIALPPPPPPDSLPVFLLDWASNAFTHSCMPTLSFSTYYHMLAILLPSLFLALPLIPRHSLCSFSHISQLTHSHPLSTLSPSQSHTLRHFPSPNSGTF